MNLNASLAPGNVQRSDGSATLGTIAWIAFAAIALIVLPHIGVIELMLLFAVLVVTPLCLQVLEADAFGGSDRVTRALRRAQPFAAVPAGRGPGS